MPLLDDEGVQMFCEFGGSIGLGVATDIVDPSLLESRRHLGTSLTTDPDVLHVGAVCIIEGLKNKPAWNGQSCCIERCAMSLLSCTHLYLLLLWC